MFLGQGSSRRGRGADRPSRRVRRTSRHGRTLGTGVVALLASVALLLALPLTSLGATNPLDNLGHALNAQLTHVLQTVHLIRPASTTPSASPTTTSTTSTSSSTSSSRASDSARGLTGTAPSVPAMYGTNPHAQSTSASVALTPSANKPYPYNQNGTPDNVVVGRGRSELLPTGQYHAHLTILSLLGIEPIAGLDATQGQSVSSPLTSLNKLLCGSGVNALICVKLAEASAAATASGATTNFQLSQATIAGTGGVSLGAGTSTSSIQTNYVTGCQTAIATSSVVPALNLLGIKATVANSNNTSTACPGLAPVHTANSNVIGLGGVGITAANKLLCTQGVPNTTALNLLNVLTLFCNADNTTQLPAPSGVREALTALVLSLGNSVTAKTVTAASESAAVAQTAHPVCTDADHNCGIGKNGQPEQCVNHKDLDGDFDCTGNRNQCKDTDHNCGILPNGHHEICKTGTNNDADHDQDCLNKCTDTEHDCGILPNGNREICDANGHDPDNDGDCAAAGLGISTGGPAATEAAAKGQLPFTGENVLELIVLGLLLTGGGLGIALGLRAREQH